MYFGCWWPEPGPGIGMPFLLVILHGLVAAKGRGEKGGGDVAFGERVLLV